jgi:MinD-like ATPase involved in chromosome partitioning or flagellar assembly
MKTITATNERSLSTLDLSEAREPLLDLGEARSRSPLPVAQDDARQAAARLALVAGRDRGGLFVVAGIDGRDQSGKLALALAAATASLGYGNVLVLDSVTGEHTVESAFGLGGWPGLLDLLRGTVDISQAIAQVRGTTLHVMARGTAAAPLGSPLTDPSSEAHFASLRRSFRFVFTSLRPGLLDAEGLHLASRSDGVVLALARGARRQHEVVGFRESAERLGLRLLGAVLTERREKA